MLKTIKNILLTVGSGIISFTYIFIWTILFAVTGVLLMVDWIHTLWTERRIPWIKKVMDGWSELFSRPFGNKF